MMPISPLREIFGLTAFIETGTEKGYALNTAIRAGFSKVLSCEIVNRRYLEAAARFKNNPVVSIFEGASKDMMPKMLEATKGDKRIFWLDAHLPNWGEPSIDYDINQLLPLRDELELIKESGASSDVFLIDDIVLFDKRHREKGFDLQYWVSNKGERDIAIDEIKNLFPYHIFYIDKRAEEVLIGLPGLCELKMRKGLQQIYDRYEWERA